MDHNKPYDRTDRVNNQILGILGDILIKHIDISHLGFVTFTKIDTTRDLRIAKVYYSVLNPTFSKEKINIEINKFRRPFKKSFNRLIKGLLKAFKKPFKGLLKSL